MGVVVPQIHRIRIEKFRKIQAPLELDLVAPKGDPSRTIVLAGPNGCGKTTVLEAVLLGLGMESLIVRDVEKSKREQHWRVTLEPGARIELDVSLGDGADLLTLVRTAKNHVGRFAGGEESSVSTIGLKQMAVEFFSSWRAPELVGAIHPLGAGNRPRDNENNRLRRLKQRICDDRARSGYVPRVPGTSKADSWLKRINLAWARFHGNDGTSIDARLAETKTEDEEVLADLFVVRGDAILCPVDQVSSGEIELLSFAGWIILNNFDRGLLLIDEPELHLHPQWQATLLPALRMLAPDIQMIVASHSDAVWDQAYSFERFLLVEDSDPRSMAWRSAQSITSDTSEKVAS
jgi:ATPase subunit of ABC transporter with duplicated ATPase domains